MLASETSVVEYHALDFDFLHRVYRFLARLARLVRRTRRGCDGIFGAVLAALRANGPPAGEGIATLLTGLGHGGRSSHSSLNLEYSRLSEL